MQKYNTRILTRSSKLRKIMKEKIKKYVGEIFLLGGTFMVIYNILNFSYDRGCGILTKYGIENQCNNPVAYFYSDEIRLMLGFGVVLFITGILIMKNKRES